jgi:hypothetical protein
MAVVERFQVDFFAITVLIVAVLIIVYLIIAAIYLLNLSANNKPPNQGESTFLFWTTIILGIIFLAIAIYALIRIFTYTSLYYEEEMEEIEIRDLEAELKAQEIKDAKLRQTLAAELAAEELKEAELRRQLAAKSVKTVVVRPSPTVTVTNAAPIKIANTSTIKPVVVPSHVEYVRVTNPTNYSANVSDIPVAERQRTALNEELINLQSPFEE